MEVQLHPDLQGNILARDAASAIEACVHCGFCLATCPTYLDSRDERDSPRGRIYLIKDLLESGDSSATSQFHLDRCLTCRSCETTCPSGVAYGDIADAGRALMENTVPRQPIDQLQRALLRRVVPNPRIFRPLLRLGQLCRPLLPAVLREHVPPRQQPVPPLKSDEAVEVVKSVLLLEGCVQATATPATNQSMRNILARIGVQVVESPSQGCCGALNTHLGALDAGLMNMRRNIDAWWPAIESGTEAIVFSATGCGVQLVDYGKALAHDPSYAEKARRVSELSMDAAAFLLTMDLDHLPVTPPVQTKLAVQAPCSQTHGLGSAGDVPELLSRLGYKLSQTREDHLCCGSAGSYSLLQPAMSQRLRERKLDALTIDEPELIVSANIGCQLHLTAASPVPVRHWLELVEERLS